MSDNLKPCEICERANCSADLHFPPTLRDQFAMAALTGLLAYPGTFAEPNSSHLLSYGFEQFNVEFLAHRRQISERVYQLADAMLATREKKS